VTFRETSLAGAFLVEPDRLQDERGFFARSFCSREFERCGLDARVAQCNISFSRRKGTLRGLHYQGEQGEEAKLVRCTRGAIFDVIVDLRRRSQSYLKHYAVKLDSENRLMLFAPEGFAHGFLTLEDDTEVFYQMSEFYVPEAARGIRWNDPLLGIPWPFEPVVISEKDRNHPDFVHA
jgi:dTDP-4-dehydrorhamnose 3,5-epimerase